MTVLCPVLNAIIIVFTFDGNVHFVSHEGQIQYNDTIDPLVVHTNMSILPALNDVSCPLSVFYIDGTTAYPVEYQKDAEAKPAEGLYVYRDHLFITKDTSQLKNLPTSRWVLPFLPMGALEVQVTTKSVTSVRTTDWTQDFYVSVSDVHLVSTRAPDATTLFLFVGHNCIFTENWNLSFSAPIRSVFVQTAQGTYEVVGHVTTWTVFCEQNSCRPVVFPMETLHTKELFVADSSVKRAFIVTNGVSSWGVLENPDIRYDSHFTDWPRLPPARPTLPIVYPRISSPRRRKRWLVLVCTAAVLVLLVVWLIGLYSRKQLHFFYASPLMDEYYRQILPLEVDKEMEGLHAIASVASLERISDAAVRGEFIHISCHTRGAHMIFEDHGLSHQVSQEQLVEAVDGAWFVFFAACHTWDTVLKLPKSIPFAIGTTGEVADKDIRIFAQHFYKELFAGRDIESSFRRAQLLASYNTSVFELRALYPMRKMHRFISRVLTFGTIGWLLPGLRYAPVQPALDFGVDDVVGREKDMVQMATLFRRRRVIALSGFGAFVLAKEFVRYFSMPGRIFPDVVFAGSDIPSNSSTTVKGSLLVLEPHVDPSVVTWLVDNWPPWHDCRVLVVGNADVIQPLEAQLPCKVARVELQALPPAASATLFLRRVHRPLGIKDFESCPNDNELPEHLLRHPVVGPVLLRGDPELIIRLAQRVRCSLESLFDLRDAAAAILASESVTQTIRVQTIDVDDASPKIVCPELIRDNSAGSRHASNIGTSASGSVVELVRESSATSNTQTVSGSEGVGALRE